MPLRDNPVRAKLKRGEISIGTMVFEFFSPGMPRLLATTGVEFAIYDMEHTSTRSWRARSTTECSA
jgi:hypothetical protein